MESTTVRKATTPKNTGPKVPASPPAGTVPKNSLQDDFTTLKEAAAAVQRLRLSAQRELELARKLRADALRYHQETATKARSEAQQIVLKTRLAAQREVEEMIRKASEEIQKMLADIRMIRITAQEELAAQRKFTDAARLSTMSLALSKGLEKPASEPRKKRQLASAK